MFEVPSGVAVVRWQLGRRLRRLRDESGRTLEYVSRQVDRSRPTLWKMEGGRMVTVRRSDVDALCRVYLASDEEREILAGLAAITRVTRWGDDLAELLPAGYDLYQNLESEAETARSYEDLLIPELLWTEGYARSVLANDGTVSDEEIRRRLTEGASRRALLCRPAWPLRMEILLAECVLHRPVGGPPVMAYQLRRLLELSDLPTVTIRVVPAAAGMHHGLRTGRFTVLGFPTGDGSPIAYADVAGRSRRIWDRPDDVERFAAAYRSIHAQTLDEPASQRCITTAATALGT